MLSVGIQQKRINMDLETMINDVLPEGSVLVKNHHGGFAFYVDDDHYILGVDLMRQGEETLESFVKRVIKKLIKLENRDDIPGVEIDCVIHGGIDD